MYCSMFLSEVVGKFFDQFPATLSSTFKDRTWVKGNLQFLQQSNFYSELVLMVGGVPYLQE